MTTDVKAKNPASIFSHETLLHVLNDLSAHDLAALERVSRSWNSIVRRSSVWHNLYLSEFGTKHLRRHGRIEKKRRNWKGLFRRQSNWKDGRCKKVESMLPQLLNSEKSVGEDRLGLTLTHQNNIYFCNDVQISKWSSVGNSLKCQAISSFRDETVKSGPAVMCLDNASLYIGLKDGNLLHVTVHETGFGNIENLATFSTKFVALSSHKNYICGLTNDNNLYILQHSHQAGTKLKVLGKYHVSSIEKQVAIHFQQSKEGYEVVHVVFNDYVLSGGWTVSLQEFVFNEYCVKSSRLALHDNKDIEYSQQPASAIFMYGSYILTSHPDNSLILQRLYSTNNELRIKFLGRLLGHVCGVQISKLFSCGRIVSVSKNCADICVWDLHDTNYQSIVSPLMLTCTNIHNKPVSDYEKECKVQDIGLYEDTILITLSDGRILKFLFNI
ncbi:F-box protein Pof12 [Schizosaccharomyces pombe]|uniref:F-box protein pof12 n=1 Tax=Schizosaccharomyces pombe (strain 972 / ATCC 24843) TaxID=284812 RepID=POF12_SCHPO|nr:F-box protein Pof12 [Schizosaccharomyces pombe]O60053.1 RecName: Full=F-box protein pof12 [Schizosaccharomyces pombe 972h-]BAB55637.1 F-box protein Pof12 [Schizosaccharomyces pombe]CAA18880.1 F-box protein Pof12 [Schizosaccharomyces pombe]|eukprot:NP_596716.1 F-box protein Pof12 [Schizosaccharomyces pombe]